MAVNNPAPTNDEPTPEEKKKFESWLGGHLAELDAKRNAQPPAPAPAPAQAPRQAPAQDSGSIADIVRRVMDDRDKEHNTNKRIEELENQIKGMKPAKKRPWFSPLVD